MEAGSPHRHAPQLFPERTQPLGVFVREACEGRQPKPRIKTAHAHASGPKLEGKRKETGSGRQKGKKGKKKLKTS